MSLSDRILAALPQTQCTRCGFPDCAHYAQAIAQGSANINQCPPGGHTGIERLAALTGLPIQPLNPANGVEAPRELAWIDEGWCIGCTLCVPVCPTDAIFGSHKHMHVVIESHCTGCGLCLPVCPVDCIEMENASGEHTGWQAWDEHAAHHARDRYAARLHRLAQEAPPSLGQDDGPLQQEMDSPKNTEKAALMPGDEQTRKKSMIEAALARAHALKTNHR